MAWRGQEHPTRHVVQDGDLVGQELPGLVQRAPADDRRVRVVALERLQPLRDVGGVPALVVVLGPEPLQPQSANSPQTRYPSRSA